jgi:hypothetical protein
MNLHKRIYFCFSLSLFSFFLSIDRNRRLSSPKSLGCLGFCFSYIKRWRVLVWLPFQLLIVDTRERNVGKGFIYVDFVLIWRTAERIDSPQCIPSIYCCAHGVCVHCTLGAVWWWCIPTDDSHLRFVSLKCHYVSARFAEEATTSAECVTRHSRQALRSTRRTSLLYPVEGRNLRDDDQKDFSNRQEGLIIYFKKRKKQKTWRWNCSKQPDQKM